jgi:hypothetical protein
MSALIDGVAWAASCVGLAVRNTDLGYLEVQGGTLDLTQNMKFRVYATQHGPYVLGGSEAAPVGMGSSAALSLGCQPHPGSCPAWYVAPCCGQIDGNGNGSITVSELTVSRASGRFSFNLIANSVTGATGAKVVTNGVFNVTF